jgi:hypothetical protein
MGKDMSKFLVRATEEVFYSVIMEADSMDALREKLAKGSFNFADFETNNAGEFNIDSIEEVQDA